MKIHNRFDFYVEKENQLTKVGEAQNIVLDSFYNKSAAAYLGFTSNPFEYIHVGSGNTTPLVTDLSLTSLIGAKVANRDSCTYDKDTKVFTYNLSIEIGVTEFNGTFISEVGIGTSNTANTLITKALVKDNNGQPISIEKKSDERLLIYATVFINRDTYLLGANRLEGLDAIYGVTAGFHDIAYLLASAKRNGAQYYPYTQHAFCNHYMKGNGLCKYIASISTGLTLAYVKSATVSGRDTSSILDTGENNGANIFGVAFTRTNSLMPFYSTTFNNTGVLYDAKCLPVDNLIASLGTGDGTQVTFPLKHFGAKGIKALINGIENTNVVIGSKGNYEGVPTLDEYCVRTWKGVGGQYNMDYPYNVTFSLPIPYLEGFVVLSNKYSVGTKLIGLYHHIVSDELFVEAVEIDLNANKTVMQITATPDNAALILNSDTGYEIYQYDSATGTIGLLLVSGAGRIYFTTDMSKAVVSDNVYHTGTTTSCNIYMFNVVRTTDAITLTALFNTKVIGPSEGDYPTLAGDMEPTGSPYIEKDCISWCVRNGYNGNYPRYTSELYKIDWVNSTVLKETVATIPNNCVGKYFVVKKLADGVQIGKRETNGSITWLNSIIIPSFVGASCNLRYVYDTDDHIYIGWNVGASDYIACTNCICLQVVNDVAYDTGSNCGALELVKTWSKATLGAMSFISYMNKNLPSSQEYRPSYGMPRVLYPMNQTVTFNTAPVVGATVGAQYALDYLPKDINWTVNSSFNTSVARG